MHIAPEIQDIITSNGLLLAFVMVVLTLLSWVVSPTIWTIEITDGKSKGDTKGYLLFLFLFFSVMSALLVYFDQNLLDSTNGRLSQTSLFIANIFIVLIYAIADLVIVDFIIYSRIKPEFMQIKGIEPALNFLHHVKYFIRLMVFSAVFAFIASIISTVL